MKAVVKSQYILGACLAWLLLLPEVRGFTDYYEVLKVPRHASVKDIKSGFRKQSVLLHPDRNRDEGAVEAFQRLRLAYETLLDASSRSLYDQYGRFWKEMQEYKEKHLKRYHQRFVQRNGYMFRENVAVDIEEMFWGVKEVTILHHSFAKEALQTHKGVWVLFFGNPNCRPCRSLAPRVKAFAQHLVASSIDWIEVGTVNMAIDANQALLEFFGSAAHSIPQLIVVAPPQLEGDVGLEARLGVYEVLERDSTMSMDALVEFLIAKCTEMRQTVPLIKLEGRSVQDAVKSLGMGPMGRPVVLYTNGYSEMVPVFAQFSQKFADTGLRFFIVNCASSESASGPDCVAAAEERNLPLLKMYDGKTMEQLVESPIRVEEMMHTIEQYQYEPAQVTIAAYLDSYYQFSVEALLPAAPAALQVSGSPIGICNGKYVRGGIAQSRVYYHKEDQDVFIRWIPSQFR